MTADNIDKLLFQNHSKDDGEPYRGDYLEIYKLYVTSADNVSSRRHVANSFFLTLNTALLAFLGITKPMLTQYSSQLPLILPLGGILLCYTWFRLIQSYKGLNSAKFEVIHAIEKHLPIAPFFAEWQMVKKGKNKKKYTPFTHVEVYVPWVFVLIYVFSALLTVL